MLLKFILTLFWPLLFTWLVILNQLNFCCYLFSKWFVVFSTVVSIAWSLLSIRFLSLPCFLMLNTLSQVFMSLGSDIKQLPCFPHHNRWQSIIGNPIYQSFFWLSRCLSKTSLGKKIVWNTKGALYVKIRRLFCWYQTRTRETKQNYWEIELIVNKWATPSKETR